MVYLVGPLAIVSAYSGRAFQRTADSDGLTIGEPLLEAAGAAGRRACVAHPMTGEQVAFATRVIRANGHDAVITISDVFPVDWQWPDERPVPGGLP